MSETPVLETYAGSVPVRRGKVRDVYDLGDRLVLVATDRISAFDWILPTGIPGKGRVLTAMSLFWFRFLGETGQILSTELSDMGPEFSARPEIFAGRSILVKTTTVFPIECVARGYLAGSGWKEYKNSQTVCGESLPVGLVESDRLPEPIFTPATKAETGHDENIPFAEMARRLDADVANQLRQRTLELYRKASLYSLRRGIILADTKFEFGRSAAGEILLIDEALTPDSSRFWPADLYKPGGPQPSFDKQFVRDWLESVGYDKQSPPPPLPPDVAERTRRKYVEAFERLTGKTSCQ